MRPHEEHVPSFAGVPAAQLDIVGMSFIAKLPPSHLLNNNMMKMLTEAASPSLQYHSVEDDGRLYDWFIGVWRSFSMVSVFPAMLLMS